MSGLKHNLSDELIVREVVLLNLRNYNVVFNFATKLIRQLRHLCSLFIHFHRFVNKQILPKQMLSQSALWTLWIDNCIKSKKL
jgi:hypothetical protein